MPNITSTAICLNKNSGKKSYFVIHGTDFAANATVKVTDSASGDWDPKIMSQTTTKIVVKVKAPNRARPKPEEIETLDITVTNPATGESDVQSEPMESLDDANP